jgi:hypothetical protein
MAYFEIRTGLGLEENPDSRKPGHPKFAYTQSFIFLHTLTGCLMTGIKFLFASKYLFY